MPSLQRHYLPCGAIRKTPIKGRAAGPIDHFGAAHAPGYLRTALRMMNPRPINAVSASD